MASRVRPPSKLGTSTAKVVGPVRTTTPLAGAISCSRLAISVPKLSAVWPLNTACSSGRSLKWNTAMLSGCRSRCAFSSIASPSKARRWVSLGKTFLCAGAVTGPSEAGTGPDRWRTVQIPSSAPMVAMASCT